MPLSHPVLFVLLFLFTGSTASAQSTPGVMNFFSARWYDQYQAETRIALVRQLEENDWYAVDSLYEWTDRSGETTLRTTKHDLAPYVDEDGYVVYWVPDVAPQFPGGKTALQQYMRDVVGSVVSGPDDEVQSSVYIRCTIDSDGSITDVAEAQTHSEWIPVEVIAQCVDAVRYMPAWLPGVVKGKPVRVCVLVEFSLKE